MNPLREGGWWRRGAVVLRPGASSKQSDRLLNMLCNHRTPSACRLACENAHFGTDFRLKIVNVNSGSMLLTKLDTFIERTGSGAGDVLRTTTEFL
jgi:hypothetical protein